MGCGGWWVSGGSNKNIKKINKNEANSYNIPYLFSPFLSVKV